MSIELSPGELQTMQDIADGLGTKEIMKLRYLSEGAIKSRIGFVLEKIGNEPDGEGWNVDRTRALLYLIRKGIITITPDMPDKWIKD